MPNKIDCDIQVVSVCKGRKKFEGKRAKSYSELLHSKNDFEQLMF